MEKYAAYLVSPFFFHLLEVSNEVVKELTRAEPLLCMGLYKRHQLFTKDNQLILHLEEVRAVWRK